MAAQNPIEAIVARIRELVGDAASADLLPDIQDLFEQFELVPKSTFNNHLESLAELQARVRELEARLAELESD